MVNWFGTFKETKLGEYKFSTEPKVPLDRESISIILGSGWGARKVIIEILFCGIQ
jgi:hypothetical protein